MATINLLPWRTERRRQREREFYAMLGVAAAVAILAWFMWGYWMGQRLDDQDARNNYMKDQIHQLDGKLAEIKELETTKSKLLARKQVIEQLQASRSQMVHLFDELVKTVPEGVRLTSLKQEGDVLTLQGVAQANGSVAAYMRNLDGSQWLAHSDLQKTEVKGADQRNRYEFSLKVKLKSSDQQQDNGDASAGSGTSAKKPVPKTGGGKP